MAYIWVVYNEGDEGLEWGRVFGSRGEAIRIGLSGVSKSQYKEYKEDFVGLEAPRKAQMDNEAGTIKHALVRAVELFWGA